MTDSIHCRPGVTNAMARLAAENEQLKAELLAAQKRAADSADEVYRLRRIGDHWAQKNPELADQYRAEALRCRNLLGFASHAQDVSPYALGEAIIDLQIQDAERPKEST